MRNTQKRTSKKSQNGGWYIPRKLVRLHEENVVDATDLVMLAVMFEFSDEDAVCSVSPEFLAERMGFTEQHLRRRIKRLRYLNLLRPVGKVGRRTEYLVVINLRHPSSKNPRVRAHTPQRRVTPSLEGEPYQRRRPFQGLTSSFSKSRVKQEPTVRAGFFPQENLTASQNFARQCAKQLWTALQEKRKIMRKANIAQWGKHIENLHTVDHVSQSDIQKALDWYCENIGERYVPQAYSTKAFREKFDKVWAAMKNDEGNLDKIVVSKEAQELIAQLPSWQWPGDGSEQFAGAVEISLQTYNQLFDAAWDKVGKHFKKWKRSPESFTGDTEFLLQFYSYLSQHFGSEATFLSNWFERVHAKVMRMQNWDGDLRPFAASWDNKRFLMMGKTCSVENYGDTKAWQRFLRLINEG